MSFYRSKKRKKCQEQIVNKAEKEEKILIERQENTVNFHQEQRPHLAKTLVYNEKNERERLTISIALPGSLIQRVPTPELRTYLVSQVAKALVYNEIDEIIVYDDSPDVDSEKVRYSSFFCHLLQFLECPPYLRKNLFQHHEDLKFVGSKKKRG